MKKIKSITITELFGYEDNNYTLDLFPNSLISFLYGLNGIGKTTLFRLVYAALKEKLTLLDSVLFKSLKITFDNNESLIVEKTVNKRFDDIILGELQKDETGVYYFPITYKWVSADNNVTEGKYYFTKSISDFISKQLDEKFDNISKLHFFVNEKTKQQEYLSDFWKKMYVENYLSSNNPSKTREMISNNICMFNATEILYANKDYDRTISSQMSRSKNDDGNILESIFENFEPLDTISFDYNYVKKLLDKRFFEISTMSDMTQEEWISGRTEGYDNEKKYISFKIPDKIDFLTKKLKKIADSPMVHYGISESEIKYEQDVSLFEDIINQHPGLTDKEIFIDKKKGTMEVRMFGQRDKLLPVGSLSSGEKNWLLLNFFLIFCVKNNSILFIDEPEVSMHPEWLINFTDNVERIFEGRNNQIIIATHSPSITYYSGHLMARLRRF